ncbi:MAG TPA: helix-turn-helix domain-containing protein [Pyrinomonadaceae bacterium]|jgi:transcriptional regulator with GAF, ATPase, and Fis domain
MKLVKGTRTSPAHRDQLGGGTLETLKEIVSALSGVMDTLGGAQPQLPDVEGGADFYEEVRRFECALIQRALRRTAGNQAQAARLLNLKQTTLHEKIKRYNIRPETVSYYDDCAARVNARRQALQDS